jgi:hypothetical protein
MVEFVSSQKWKEFKEMRDKGINGKVSTEQLYDTA